MNLESKRINGISKEINKVIARETGKNFIMNRRLARIIVCLMDNKLKLPSMMLESLEENLVNGKFDKVYECYCKRLLEIEKETKTSNINIKKVIFIKNYSLGGRVTKKQYLDNAFNKKMCDEYCSKEQIQALLDEEVDWIFFWTPE